MPNHPFGLSENPFTDGHDRRFIYPAGKRVEAVALLRRRIADGESFVTITGESGCGKTSVVTELLEDETLKTRVAFIAHPSLTPSELLEAVCIEFGAQLPISPSKPQTLAALEHRLRDLRVQGLAAVLVLDEAHGLKTELLEEARLLSNMKAGGRGLLQTILVGVPELERRLGLLELAQLRQRIAFHCRMLPLTADETEGYLRHRVTAAGGDGAAILPAEACQEIHNYTNGLPRDINTLAGRALECADQDGAGAVSVEHVRMAAGDARPRGIATSPRASSGTQPFELRRKASLSRQSPEPPRAPERPVDPEPPLAPPRPKVRKPLSFLRAQHTARAGDANAAEPATMEAARATLEQRFRNGEITAAELAAERTAQADRAVGPRGVLGSEGVRELGASVLLIGLLVIVLMASGRWDPLAPPPEPPVAEISSPPWPDDIQGGSSGHANTRSAQAMVDAPADLPLPADLSPLPGTVIPDLSLGGEGRRLRGIAFEVASSSYPDSAGLALRKIMRGSKLPCRIVTKSSGDTYRVVVGPFQSRREAEKAITELFRHALVERARIVQLVE